MTLTLADIVRITGGELRGEEHHSVSQVSDLGNADENSLCFISDSKYLEQLKKTSAGVVLLTKELADVCPVNAIIVDNPMLAYARAASLIFPQSHNSSGIHNTAVVADSCSIGKNVTVSACTRINENVTLGDDTFIGTSCVLGANTVVGKRCRLLDNVTICDGTIIGDDVTLHPGCVIGSDGFGFARDGKSWVKIPQAGRVILGNNVDIGANSTVDRGTIHDTMIADGVKIDNQVHVAHNVTIGSNTIIAGCAGIAGSARIGNNCMIGGGSGISDHVRVPDDTVITAMTFVNHTLDKSGIYSSGMPVQDNRQWRKNMVRLSKLDELARNVNKLIKRFI